MFDYQALTKKHRFEGLLGVAAVFASVFVAVASVTVVAAQTAFEFEDPLDDLREQLGMPAVEGGQGAGTAEQVAAVGSDGSDAMSSFGLFAIAAAILLALIIGLVWWLGRKRRERRRAQDSDADVYTTDDYSPPRHVLESGSAVTRERSVRMDTREDASPSKGALAVAAPTAAASAAMILSDEADEVKDDVEEKTGRVDLAKSPSRDDPDSWDQPNLDRLKDSIREDWHGTAASTAAGAATATTAVVSSKVDTAAEKVSDTSAAMKTDIDDFRSDSDTFDTMFGDDAAPIEHPSSNDPSFANQINDIATNDAAVDLDNAGLEGGSAHMPSRNDALKRIKALRESVKAG